ncbi:MAG: response regulator [Lachnospiraceae bacterium]|nr:response regulator [Lachnospiraceae bacterium]
MKHKSKVNFRRNASVIIGAVLLLIIALINTTISFDKIDEYLEKNSVNIQSGEYTSILFAHILVIFASFIIYFGVLAAAHISYTNEKKAESIYTADVFDSMNRKYESKSQIIESFSRLYCAIYMVDIENDRIYEIAGEGEIKQIIGTDGSASEKLSELCDTYIWPEYREEMESFIDIHTLGTRLRENPVLSMEYLTDDEIWQKAGFIAGEYNDDGEVTSALYITRVIDEEKMRELEYHNGLLNAIDDANRANTAKSDFLSRMSHDIRTPINGILGMIDIAKKNMDNVEKQYDCFDKMEESSNQLLTIINDVLNMSKLESGNIEFANERFDLKEVIDECVSDIMAQALEQGITVRKGDIAFEHNHVMGSPLHIRQILINIYGNAVKYTERGGYVKIVSEEIDCDGADATYKFVVTDTGIGMSERFLKNIYQPFSQEDHGARTTYRGTGLGLSIVKKIVDNMGGVIEVQSKEGIGSTFTVILTLPIAETGNEKKDESPEIAEEGVDILSGKNILVVEDNIINMEIAKFMLEEEGVNVITAENGKEGLDRFMQSDINEINVILMDLMMPVMDGIEAAGAIRRLGRADAGTVPILAMTAKAFVEDVIAVKEAGMNDHISKPIEKNKFFDTIKKWI